MRHNWRIFVLLGLMLPASSQMAPPPQLAEQAPPPAPVGRMYAIYAHGAVPEQPYTDESLKPVASILNRLPFTSYREVSIVEQEMPWGRATLFPINAVYTMVVSPLSLSEEGIIELDARVEMLQDNGEYTSALQADAAAAQDKALIFRGMPLQNGELVVVLLVGMPKEESQSQSQPQESEEEEQQEEQEQQQQEEQQEEAQEQEQERQEMTLEGEAPEGLENLDALLESLEDIDKREQIEERNRRNRIDFKGNWW